MKATGIIWTAVLALLLGVAVQAPCLPQQSSEKSKGAQPQSQQRPPQEPRQSHSSPPPPQANPQPPTNNPRQQYEHVDRGQQERNQQRQPPPEKSRGQSGSNRPQQPDTRDQNGQHPQGFDKNKPRLPFDQQHARQNDDNRDGRDHRRPDYHQDNRRDHRDDWKGRRARDWRSDHRTWEQRGGYRGYRIPEYRFGQYFGPRHFFRIHDLHVLIFNGYPRFQYGGYWFSLVDPWPEYWDEDWYETDDVYIAYADDGYYLYNRRYPGVGIAVNISM